MSRPANATTASPAPAPTRVVVLGGGVGGRAAAQHLDHPFRASRGAEAAYRGRARRRL